MDYSVLLGELKLTSEQIAELRSEARNSSSSLSVNGIYVASNVVRGKDEETEASLEVLEKAYIIGVIDTLTSFNFVKKAEFGFKRCRHGNQMSCVPPPQYEQRFTKFMTECFSQQQTSVQEAPKALPINLSSITAVTTVDGKVKEENKSRNDIN